MNTEFHQLTISEVERLTKDAVALTFDLPEELRSEYQYVQGQHLTLKTMINGEDIRRSYSICTNPSEHKLQVGIKQIPEGIFSSFANETLKAGMTLEVMPPQGHFYIDLDKGNDKHYLMIAAGSGITPMLSHIQAIFEQEPQSKITLIYGNKSTPMMMFREKLSFIKNNNLERFHWINLFTREDNEAELLNGRIDRDKLIAMHNSKLIDLKSFNDIFLCGPEAMIVNVTTYLKFIGLQDDNIHYELFHSESADQKSKENQSVRAEKYAGKSADVAVKVAGRTTRMELAMDGGQNVLEAALENGADVPYACKAGVCATCKAKVIKGKVEMDANHSLTEQEVADGVVLTCQAHPISEDVELDFDYT